MERQEILEKLTHIAQTVFENDNLELTEESSAQNVDNWTSLTFMQFLTAIEKDFGFKFKIAELMSIKDVSGIITAIQKHV